MTPANVVPSEIEPADRSKAKYQYYAPDGSPFPNLGCQRISAKDQSSHPIRMQSGIPNITKPIAPVYTIANTNNEVTLRNDGGHVKNLDAGKVTPLRLDGKLH